MFPILILGGAVLGENEVGVADEVSFIGIDDLVLVAVSPGKVLGDTGFHVVDPLTQNLIYGERDVVNIF